MTRSHTVVAITILLGGCVTEASLLSSPAAPSCGEDVETVVAPEELGCTSIEVDGSDALACDLSWVPDSGPAPYIHGHRVRVRRAYDQPTVLRVEVLGAPPTCPGDTACPRQLYWHAGGGCACGGGVAGTYFDEGAFETRLPPGDSTVIIPDATRRYRVSACTVERGEWPIYPECGGSARGGVAAGSSCWPSCFTDADCPATTSGTAATVCSSDTMCLLTCGSGETCPDGQICADFQGRMVCLVPPSPEE